MTLCVVAYRKADSELVSPINNGRTTRSTVWPRYLLQATVNPANSVAPVTDSTNIRGSRRAYSVIKRMSAPQWRLSPGD